tara:strand:- start:746 stop:1216 length:471 start_codon:yes stop_codon:yes gene_type:complete
MRDNNLTRSENMTLSNEEYKRKLYSKAAERATNELEENTVWAMAEVHSSADEAIEIADDLQETIRKIAYVSKMKLNLGVNREMHGKNKVLEAASLAEGSGTEMMYHEIGSLRTWINDSLDQIESNLGKLQDAQQAEKPVIVGQEKIKQDLENLNAK